jgi:hypothetical protein
MNPGGQELCKSGEGGMRRRTKEMEPTLLCSVEVVAFFVNHNLLVLALVACGYVEWRPSLLSSSFTLYCRFPFAFSVRLDLEW